MFRERLDRESKPLVEADRRLVIEVSLRGSEVSQAMAHIADSRRGMHRHDSDSECVFEDREHLKQRVGSVPGDVVDAS